MVSSTELIFKSGNYLHKNEYLCGLRGHVEYMKNTCT